MDWRRKRRLIDRNQAAREGRRYAAFYHGFKDFKTRRTISENPYPQGSSDYRGWQAGYEYAGLGNDYMEKNHGPA